MKSVVKKLVYATAALAILSTACTKDEPFALYNGKEVPGNIPGFGDCIGEFQGDWLKLPAGVEYAGPIRGESCFVFDGKYKPVTVGTGYYVKVTIPLKNPNNVPIEFPAGLIMVPRPTPVEAESKAYEWNEGFIDDFPPKPFTFAAVTTRASDDPCANKSWLRQRWEDLKFENWGSDKCKTKNVKDNHQAGVNVQPAKPKPNIFAPDPDDSQWYKSGTTSGTSVTTRASLVEPGLYYVTLYLYCGNENESRPSASSAWFYPPIVSSSSLLKWFCKMLDGKDLIGHEVAVQNLLWKLTDKDGITQEDIEWIKNLPNERK